MGTLAWGCGVLPAWKLGVPPSCALSMDASQDAAPSHCGPGPGHDGALRGPRGEFPQGAAGSSEHTTVVATCPGHGELRHQGHRTPVCGPFQPQSSRAGAARPAVHHQGSPCGPQWPAELFQRTLKRDADGRSRGNKGRPGLVATLPGAGKIPSSPGGAATHPAGSAGAPQLASSPAAPALGRDTKKAGCLWGHCGACGHHQPQ